MSLTFLRAVGLLGLLCEGLCTPRLAAADASSRIASTPQAKGSKVEFARDVQPVLSQYCYGCHGEKKKGGVDFRVYTDEKSALQARPVFEKVLKNLEAHEMPPENKPQP